MSKFRKKPVVIEAYQTREMMIIPTLEGDHRADPGDWIITGIKGEQYPCKPEIFAQTYEPADDLPPITEEKPGIEILEGPGGIYIRFWNTITQATGVFTAEEALNISNDLRNAIDRHRER